MEFTQNQRVFLDAGADLLEQAITDVAMRALTVRALTKRASRSTGAFYHYWETQADFIRDLIPYVLDPATLVKDDPATGRLERQMESDTVDAQWLIDAFDVVCTEFTNSRAIQLQLLLAALPRDHSAQAVLRSVYREDQIRLGALYEQIFADRGVELVEGMSYEDFAALGTALLDGLALRRKFDPDVANSDAARRMLVSFLCGMFVRSDDPDKDVSLVERLDRLLGRFTSPLCR